MLEKNIIKKIGLYFSSFLLIEIVSYLSLISVNLNQVVYVLLAVILIIVSFYSLEYALLIIFAELFIGSMGHLFVMSIFGQVVPIRMIFWLIVMLKFITNFIWQLIKDKKRGEYLEALKNFSALKYLLILGFFVTLSLVNAYLRGNEFNLIFSDANSYLYFLLIFPLVVVYKNYSSKTLDNLKVLFISASIWISLKTLFLLFVFTHNLSFASEVYYWLRKTLVGEMTATLSGWPRVFIQSQIYSGLALFFTFWAYLKIKSDNYFKIIINFFISILFASSLLISFSRSFWVGLICAILFSLIAVWLIYDFKKVVQGIFWFVVSFLLGFILIYLVAILPYHQAGDFKADFVGRISNTNESAISSRWSLLPVLSKEIMREPFFGQGHGATITYISSDPRVLKNNPSGRYTTYAFEWGYFDIWLKIGLFGVLSYLVLLGYLLKNALKYSLKNQDYISLGLASGIVFLAVTNFFTPFLNHPLGIGILILGSCLIQRDKVY